MKNKYSKVLMAIDKKCVTNASKNYEKKKNNKKLKSKKKTKQSNKKKNKTIKIKQSITRIKIKRNKTTRISTVRQPLDSRHVKSSINTNIVSRETEILKTALA